MQEGLDRVALAGATGLGLHHHLAAQQGQPGRLLDRGLHGLQAQRFELGRLPIVQGQRTALVFDAQARMLGCQRGRGFLDPLQRMGCDQCDVAAGTAPLSAVDAGHGQAQRPKEAVDLLDGTARNQGQRAAEVLFQRLQRAHEARRHDDGFRLIRQIDQGPVEIKKECARWAKNVHKIHVS